MHLETFIGGVHEPARVHGHHSTQGDLRDDGRLQVFTFIHVAGDLIDVHFLEVSIDQLLFNAHLYLLLVDDSLILLCFGKVIYEDISCIGSKDQSSHVLVNIECFHLLMWDSNVKLDDYGVFLS